MTRSVLRPAQAHPTSQAFGSEARCQESGCADKGYTLVESHHFNSYVCTECGVVSDQSLDLQETRIIYPASDDDDARPPPPSAPTRIEVTQALKHATGLLYRSERADRTTDQKRADVIEHNLARATRVLDRAHVQNEELRTVALDLFRRFVQTMERCMKPALTIAVCVVEAAARLACTDTSYSVSRVADRFLGTEKSRAVRDINRARKRMALKLGLGKPGRPTKLKQEVETLCVLVDADSDERVRVAAQLKLTCTQLETDSKLAGKQDSTLACAIIVAAIGKQGRSKGKHTISPASLSKSTRISNGSIGACVKELNVVGVVVK